MKSKFNWTIISIIATVILVIFIIVFVIIGINKGWFTRQKEVFVEAEQTGTTFTPAYSTCSELCTANNYSFAYDNNGCLGGEVKTEYGFPNEAPLLNCCCSDTKRDTDGDGIPDSQDPDDDNDGFTDDEEAQAGTDPLDKNDFPQVEDFPEQEGAYSFQECRGLADENSVYFSKMTDDGSDWTEETCYDYANDRCNTDTAFSRNCCWWNCEIVWNSGDFIFGKAYVEDLFSGQSILKTVNLDDKDVEGQPICIKVERGISFDQSPNPSNIVYLYVNPSVGTPFTFADTNQIESISSDIIPFSGSYGYTNGVPFEFEFVNDMNHRIDYVVGLTFKIC